MQHYMSLHEDIFMMEFKVEISLGSLYNMKKASKFLITWWGQPVTNILLNSESSLVLWFNLILIIILQIQYHDPCSLNFLITAQVGRSHSHFYGFTFTVFFLVALEQPASRGACFFENTSRSLRNAMGLLSVDLALYIFFNKFRNT